ncbi:hypothetical protein C2G38_2060654 [Gigaspora rosea]|uniref:Uncharacterized protein n=1 Tax=Gigaspora rosea TaxID=44941 RepID=A0A397W1J7_9GLOM|nr:hypothetical protein C2G38_2060654 [Gigaspora rosea]
MTARHNSCEQTTLEYSLHYLSNQEHNDCKLSTNKPPNDCEISTTIVSKPIITAQNNRFPMSIVL